MNDRIDSGLGRIGRCPGEPKPVWPGRTPSAHGLASDGYPIPGEGDDSRSASFSVDEVH